VKLVTSCLATIAVLLCSAVAFGAMPTTSNVDNALPPDKPGDSAASQPDPIYIGVGGDTVGSATNIIGLPYSDSGNTCQYVNDYDAVCPFGGSTARDVVYRFAPAADIAIDVSLCTSLYDTKVYIFDNVVNNTIACNDDACGSDGWKSELLCVQLYAGHVYYIVVDGYSTSCGQYYLDVTECIPCVDVPCPPGALAEGEVDCYDNYDDYYNGGCNSVPPVFTNIPCDPVTGNVTVCGTYGVYNHYSGFTYRDTDWYHLDPAANTGGVTWCVTGLYYTLSGVINAAAGCPASFLSYTFANGCDTVCYNLPAGDLWLFVATGDWDLVGMPCGGNYVMTLTGYMCPPVSVENTSWSKIKADHR
jgi:hypothetical protein